VGSKTTACPASAPTVLANSTTAAGERIRRSAGKSANQARCRPVGDPDLDAATIAFVTDSGFGHDVGRRTLAAAFLHSQGQKRTLALGSLKIFETVSALSRGHVRGDH
jgi:hypothetical protein